MVMKVYKLEHSGVMVMYVGPNFVCKSVSYLNVDFKIEGEIIKCPTLKTTVPSILLQNVLMVLS
jgi:hypothetical protein